MPADRGEVRSRREFFRSVLRYAALGGLIGAGALAFRRRAPGDAWDDCPGTCAGCPMRRRCRASGDAEAGRKHR